MNKGLIIIAILVIAIVIIAVVYLSTQSQPTETSPSTTKPSPTATTPTTTSPTPTTTTSTPFTGIPGLPFSLWITIESVERTDNNLTLKLKVEAVKQTSENITINKIILELTRTDNSYKDWEIAVLNETNNQLVTINHDDLRVNTFSLETPYISSEYISFTISITVTEGELPYHVAQLIVWYNDYTEEVSSNDAFFH